MCSSDLVKDLYIEVYDNVEKYNKLVLQNGNLVYEINLETPWHTPWRTDISDHKLPTSVDVENYEINVDGHDIYNIINQFKDQLSSLEEFNLLLKEKISLIKNKNIRLDKQQQQELAYYGRKYLYSAAIYLYNGTK